MNQILLISDLGATELLIIALVILLFFGPDKIPEIARGLGEGVRKMRQVTENIKREMISQTEKNRDLKEINEDIEEGRKQIKEIEKRIKRI